MKRISLLLIVLSFSLHQQACRSRQQANSQITDSTSTTGLASKTAASLTISGHLAELGLTAESHWRGINLGDEFAKVKVTEKGESFESDADHIGYTIELTNLESADMLYYQKNNKVSSIDVDLFLNSRQSVNEYQKELETYFTSRYGASKPTAGGAVWAGSTGENISLKDVSKGKDFGLKVKIGSASGAATASVK
ncbi:hypothetical protein [Spirosoma pollinicola]|uniref:Uncharacterized protein n=1 Tax=Spirosoma pollinicola TaxID=2057025 RepID=A0A2K8Z760_9BACT|nr:hypothetical protein [Spirosoma pollinicola]AUD05678.1 hypothetical protein CWM47_29850 [Spirosoma pollinicola]